MTQPALDDPFQLDRLAKELADRESARSVYDGANVHDLPDYLPLSHNNEFLVAEDFDVEKFLLSRSHMSLADLRAELRGYLANLKEGLVQLINDDYEAFISLSTNLKDEGHRLQKIQFPLDGLKAQVLESQAELKLVQETLQRKLEQRAILREEKALLHLLLQVSESLTRLESLLLITSPENQATFVHGPDLGISRNSNVESITDDRAPENMANHLGRVAVEYIQLLYHASKAEEQRCNFYPEIEWRTERIHSTISSDLDHVFATILNKLMDRKIDGKVVEIEKSKLMQDLAECLKTYDILGLWRDAEEVMRREVVRPFVKKTIYRGALAASHSPIVPHTPLPPLNATSPSVPPKIPYTPFSSSFLGPDTPLNQPDSSPFSRFLEEMDDPLADLYSQVLRFVERDLSRTMKIAENVSVKTPLSPQTQTQTQEVDSGSEERNSFGSNRFEILANVIWEELGTAIIDELGPSIFSSGRPNEFKRNFEISQAFVLSLESLAPSVQSLQSMQSHPVFHSFEQLWQLPVYFQIRWKEIVGELETHLSNSRVDYVIPHDRDSFASSQASCAWVAVATCWTDDVFIAKLSHKFWRLTLQILTRFRKWLDHKIHRAEVDFKTSTTPIADKMGNSPLLTRSSTPTPVAGILVEHAAAEDALLQGYSSFIIDIKVMQKKVFALWRDRITMVLPDELNVDDPTRALEHVISDLTSLISPMSDQIIKVLTKRCSDALLPVRSIPSQFRAMSNKRTPSEPSYFVSTILRPLKDYFGIGTNSGPGSTLVHDHLNDYATEVFENVAQRYLGYLSAMKKTEESLRRLKKGKKTTFSLLSGGGSSKDDEDRDKARIQAQMILDVNSFEKDAESLGVVPVRSESLKGLKDVIHIMQDHDL